MSKHQGAKFINCLLVKYLIYVMDNLNVNYIQNGIKVEIFGIAHDCF